MRVIPWNTSAAAGRFDRPASHGVRARRAFRAPGVDEAALEKNSGGDRERCRVNVMHVENTAVEGRPFQSIRKRWPREPDLADERPERFVLELEAEFDVNPFRVEEWNRASDMEANEAATRGPLVIRRPSIGAPGRFRPGEPDYGPSCARLQARRRRDRERWGVDRAFELPCFSPTMAADAVRPRR